MSSWATGAFAGLGLLLLLALFLASWGVVLILLFAVSIHTRAWSAILLIKVLALLAGCFVFAWRLTTRIIFFRRTEHKKIWLKRADAPELFSALDNMQTLLKGPLIHGVAIDSDMNASASWYRWFGLWFMPRRYGYISLGLPLLATLSAEEAMAVVAHEYGHLAGYPSRWDAFFYSLRGALLELQKETVNWKDKVSRWIAQGVNRFINRFEPLAFALCRENEYGADAISARVTSPETMARSLIRFQVAINYLQNDFWPKVYAKVKDQPEPGQPYYELAELNRHTQVAANEDLCMALMRDLLQAKSTSDDTHPALAERLRALGFDPNAILVDGVLIEPIAAETAVATWFGNRPQPSLAALDLQWQNEVRSWWHGRHQNALAEREQYATRTKEKQALAALTELDDESAWRLLSLQIEDGEIVNADAVVMDFLRRHPQCVSAHISAGKRWLGNDDKLALRYFHRVMELAPARGPEIGKMLSEFYAGSDPERAKLYLVMFDKKTPPSV